MSPSQLRVRWYRLAVGALLLIFVVLSATSVCQKSATYDETSYLGAGSYLLKTHRFDDEAVLRHPVLWTVWHDLPLPFLATIPEDVWKETSVILRGQKIIGLRTDDLLLNACRFMLLPFGVILGVVIFRWSRALYGDAGGLISLTLYCFSPNLLGHAALVTPDVMLSCFAIFTAERLWRFAKTPSWGNSILAGAGLGFTLLSKYTSLLLAVVLLIADVIYRVAIRQITWRSGASIWAGLRHWPIIFAVGFVILWAAYGFDVSEATWPSGWRVLMPAGPYFRGAIYQYLESRQPHSFFLMGVLSNSGWWYYFVVVCLIKIPVGTLILIAGLFFSRRILGLRVCWDELYLVLPFALLFLYLSCFNTIQNGFRYLLPVYGLLLILLGKYGEVFLRRSSLRFGVGFLVLWTMTSSSLAWPNYVSYCNELIGGSGQGYHWLGDSNIDWGQDLKELKRFMAERGIQRVQLSYFGTADPEHYGIDYEYLPSGDSPLPRTLPLPKDEAPARFLAISSYYYQGLGLADENEKNFYRAFYKNAPNDLVGNSILIFDREEPWLRTRKPAPLAIRQILGSERRDAPLDSSP